MGDLYLIRHGQASFGEENYDRLSPCGIRQAKILGRHMAGVLGGVDAIYSGTLDRQVNTARELRDASGDLREPAPDIIRMDVFDEYDSTAVWNGARWDCASSTIWMIRARVVSPAALVTVNSKAPSSLMVPAKTVWPSCFSAGTDSPVMGASLMVVWPLVIVPSSGTFSPGRTRTVTPMGTSSTGLSMMSPSFGQM